MRVATAWQAMDRRPLRFLASSWPWRALLYVVSGAVGGAAVLAVTAVAVTGLRVPLMVPAALLLLGLWALAGVPLARLERARLRLVDLDPVADPHRPPPEPGLRALLRTRRREWASAREAGFAVLGLVLALVDAAVLGFAFVLPVLLFLSPVDDPRAWPWVVVGAVLLAGSPWVVTAWAGARATLTRTVLAPRDGELGAEITDVERSRARLVSAFESERTRIERDLHDGAQQRLASLAVVLGLARCDVEDGSPVAVRLDDAQVRLVAALEELRDLVRGLRPPVLRDHGLAAALEELAAHGPIPVRVDVELPRRPPSPIETTAYFVAAEAMANVARHSGARAARIHGRHHADRLVLEVSDDGVGGAEPAGGLRGLADRVDAVDGRLRLSSPPGGPTLVRAELPCRFE